MVKNVFGMDWHAVPRKVQMCVAKEIVSSSMMEVGGATHTMREQELLTVAEAMDPVVQDNW